MRPSTYLYSAVTVVVAAFIAYLLIWLSGGAALPVVAELARGLIWAVPLTLAASVAMFNNMLRVYDRLEKVVQEIECITSAPVTDEELNEVLSETDTLSSGLLGNAFIAILAGVLILLVEGLRQVPSPVWVTRMEVIQPDWVAVSFEFGLATLVLIILAIQFAAIPGLVALYRFFSVDRYRRSPCKEK